MAMKIGECFYRLILRIVRLTSTVERILFIYLYRLRVLRCFICFQCEKLKSVVIQLYSNDGGKRGAFLISRISKPNVL